MTITIHYKPGSALNTFTNIHLTFITTLRGKGSSKSIMLWKRKRKQREINMPKATQQASSESVGPARVPFALTWRCADGYVW